MDQKNKKNAILIPILLVVTVLSIGIAIWALFFQETEKEETVLTPIKAPSTEASAEDIPNDTGEKMEQPDGGGSVSLTFSKDVTISLEQEMAELVFANPGKSNLDIVLQIVIQDETIVQSGTLKPGKQVNKLPLLEDAHKKLQEGGYEGKFRVLYYDPETGAKAVVDTEIPISITVTK